MKISGGYIQPVRQWIEMGWNCHSPNNLHDAWRKPMPPNWCIESWMPFGQDLSAGVDAGNESAVTPNSGKPTVASGVKEHPEYQRVF